MYVHIYLPISFLIQLCFLSRVFYVLLYNFNDLFYLYIFHLDASKHYSS